MSATAYIALGSNLGDRQQNLERALQALGQWPGLQVRRVSAFYETVPVGGPPGQNAYLNGAAELTTDLGPRDLLAALLDVERSLGRVRSAPNNPRTIDLDLLLYGDLVSSGPDLILPHPHMHERWFVMAPLAEIAPDMHHPVLKKTIRALFAVVAADGASGGPVQLSEKRQQELAGLHALVTGATSGIGKAIALELATAGADVLVHGRRQDAGLDVVRQLKGRGVSSEFIAADLHSPEECEKLIGAAWARGPVHVWINNAGADTLTGATARWPFARKLRELLEVDVTATMLLARAAGARMKAQGRGTILNMGWDQAETGMEGDSGQLFAAAKAAIMAFSKSLALTLAPEVRVNCLAPGWIRTAWGEGASASWQERAVRETPLKRWGTPEDVAQTARWLVSPAAAFITGQVVRINGGAVR